MKTTFTYSLKIVLYFILFLKTIIKEQQSNTLMNFFKNKIIIFKKIVF